MANADLCCITHCQNLWKGTTKKVGVLEETVKLHIVYYITRIQMTSYASFINNMCIFI